MDKPEHRELHRGLTAFSFDELCLRCQYDAGTTSRDAEVADGCPCLYVEPCDPNCTCVKPYMSTGCRRCCRYGSLEQRTEAAHRIVGVEQQIEQLQRDLVVEQDYRRSDLAMIAQLQQELKAAKE